MTHNWTVLVGVKQVPDEDDVTIDPDSGTLNRSDAEAVLNPPDRNALEAALELKDEVDARVIAFTMGPPGAVEVLEIAVAMGCDDGALISDRAFAGSDTWPTSLTLAETAAYFDADVVVCGEETTDSSTGQVPPGIAAHKGWAQLTYVEDLDPQPDEKRLLAKRDIEGGHEWVAAELPVVVAVGYGEFEPRPAGLHRKIFAESDFEPITLDADALGIDPDVVGLMASPTKVGGQDTADPVERKAKTCEDVSELVDSLADAEVIP